MVSVCTYVIIHEYICLCFLNLYFVTDLSCSNELHYCLWQSDWLLRMASVAVVSCYNLAQGYVYNPPPYSQTSSSRIFTSVTYSWLAF